MKNQNEHQIGFSERLNPQVAFYDETGRVIAIKKVSLSIPGCSLLEEAARQHPTLTEQAASIRPINPLL